MSKTWKAAVENDRVAARLNAQYHARVENAGGVLQPSYSFGSDPENPTLLLLVLPDGVEPASIFPADFVFQEVPTNG